MSVSTSSAKSLAVMSATSPFLENTFNETINWEVLLKMLYRDDILQIVKKESKKKTVYLDTTERQIIEDMLRKGMKNKNMTSQPITKSVISQINSDISKYLNPSIKVKYFYDK